MGWTCAVRSAARAAFLSSCSPRASRKATNWWGWNWARTTTSPNRSVRASWWPACGPYCGAPPAPPRPPRSSAPGCLRSTAPVTARSSPTVRSRSPRPSSKSSPRSPASRAASSRARSCSPSRAASPSRATSARLTRTSATCAERSSRRKASRATSSRCTAWATSSQSDGVTHFPDPHGAVGHIRRRLFLLLVQAFGAVVLLTLVLLIAVVGLVLGNASRFTSAFKPPAAYALEAYYLVRGSWAGVESLPRDIPESGESQWERGLLLDAAGRVVLDHGRADSPRVGQLYS